MRSSCSNSSAAIGVAIGIAAAAVLLTALLFAKGGEGTSDALPFIIIMMGSSVAIGASSGGCCCFTKLLNRKKTAAHAEHESESSEGNPYAPADDNHS